MIESNGKSVFDKRLYNNLFSDVKIEKVSKTRVDCKTLDGLLIKNIPVLFQSSHSFERPKIGDIGVLVAPGGDVERGFIVGFKHLEKDEQDKEIEKSIVSEDGTKITYNDKDKTLKIIGNESLKIVCESKSIDLKVSGEINLDVKQAEKLKDNGVVTAACPCIVTGTNHIFASKKVKAGM